MVGILLLAFICEYIDSSLGMGYGTILSPILILVGYEPLLVVPSILISQAIAGISATIFHQKFKNVDLHPEKRDIKIALLIVLAGLCASLGAVMLAIQLPKNYLQIYIGLLVLIMGIILLSKQRFAFSWKKLAAVGVLSGFNKALSGGGFGPVVTSGQVISGNGLKNSIGITTAAEGPICIFGFLVYILFNGYFDLFLPVFLIIGALLATPLGPLRTKRIDDVWGRRTVGVLIIGLGIFTLLKTIF